MKNLLIVFLCMGVGSTTAQTNLQQYFDSIGIAGSTTIYDYQQDKWIFTDSSDAQKATLPASTFKIINSLIALEFGAVDNEKEVLKWDGKVRGFQGQPIEAWNQDTNLKEAYTNSTVWFFVEIAKRIGREKYKSILNSCDYGNGSLSEKGADFWNYGNFAITPINQINFLVRLYDEKLPFSEKTIKTVKKIMISENTPGFRIYSKSGWTQKNGQDIGWWVGYIEKKDKTYFFATRLLKDETKELREFGDLREEITRKILTEMEIL